LERNEPSPGKPALPALVFGPGSIVEGPKSPRTS
jgi:hypothetical protein